MLYRNDDVYITLYGIITYDFNESDVVRNKKGEIIKWLTSEEDITNSEIYDILTNKSKFATNNNLTKREIKKIIKDKKRSGYCRSYIGALRKNRLQEEVPFIEYEKTLLKARKNLIGITTIDKLKIKDVSNHITERIIGNGTNSRLPMSIETIKEYLLSSETMVKEKKDNTLHYENEKGKIIIDKNKNKIITVIGKEYDKT